MFFDTETTGLPVDWKTPAVDSPNNWPHLVSISWILYDITNNVMELNRNYTIYPETWDIPEESSAIHNITYEHAILNGHALRHVMNELLHQRYDVLIAHNMNFDYNVLVNAIQWDLNLPEWLNRLPKARRCTMEVSTNMCKLPSPRGSGYKYPKLSELYEHIFKRPPMTQQLHNSWYDTFLLKEIVEKSDEIRIAIGLPTRAIKRVDKDGDNKNESRTLYISLAETTR